MSQLEKIVVVTASMECPMCPTIVTGRTAEGVTVYVRYRWGNLSVRIDPREPAPNAGAEGMWILALQLDPEGLDGWLSYEEVKQHTAEILVWPEELTPRNFDDDKTGETLDDLVL